MATKKHNLSAYTLLVGKHDEERLAISDEIYGSSTRAFLVSSGALSRNESS